MKETKNHESAIKVKKVTKKFKLFYDKPNTLKEKLVFWKNNKAEERIILEDINVTIKKGETVALIGVNGSGKSTLLKLMSKIIYPTKGTLEIHGKLTSLLELGAGFHDDFTGRENIYFNASIFGLTKAEIDAKVDDIIAFSELEEFILVYLSNETNGYEIELTYNYGVEKYELGNGFSHIAIGVEKLEELRNSGKTIVIVSHSLDSIKNLCDRAIWIDDGHIEMDDSSEKVIEAYLKNCK